MNRPPVLQVGPTTPALDEMLAREFDITPLWKQADAKAFLAQEGSRFEAMATHVRHPVPADLIAGLPRLRAICNFGAGYDRIDVEAARQRDVQVANTPRVLDACVADIAMGLLIDVARGLSTTDRFVRRGEWREGRQRPLMLRVSGRKLGLLGFGGIGQAIAQRAAGFGMEVRYNTRRPVAGAPQQHVTDLIELAHWADVLVVACPGGAATRHLVNAQVLEGLGPDGILVNIARGSVVDEKALVAAIEQGTIFGAGLDVFEDEPNVPQALLDSDRVVVLSHIAGFTRESRREMEQMVCDNLRAFFETGRVLTPV